MPPASAPSPSGARRTPCSARKWGEMCSGAWKRGPEIAVGVISLWTCQTRYCSVGRSSYWIAVKLGGDKSWGRISGEFVHNVIHTTQCTMMPFTLSRFLTQILRNLYNKPKPSNFQGTQRSGNSGKVWEIQKSASWPGKSQGIRWICLKPGKNPWILFQATAFRVFILFAYLAAHAAEPKAPEGTLKQFIPLTDTAIISKLEMKAHLLLVCCIDSGSQVMQCNKHVLWLAVVVVQGTSVDCSSQKDRWAYQKCTVCHYTKQMSVLHFEIEDHVASV